MKKSASPHILTVNCGSSSIKFAIFAIANSLHQIVEGKIERIGLPKSLFEVRSLNSLDNISQFVPVPNHKTAVDMLINWLKKRSECEFTAIGHRVVHGGPTYFKPQQITAKMLADLRELNSFDQEHLPAELLLMEAFQHHFPSIHQIACFDTAFHHDLPRVAQLLPLPRRYEAKGIRRYGFHGLSYEFIMEELTRLNDPAVTKGRIILAHLGNGASLAAVRDGKSIDTSMSLTPTSGLPMSTRSGDLDPSLFGYLAQTEGMDAKQFNKIVNFQSGLLGISETSSDMHDLLLLENQDVRAAEAIALFCYQVKKWIGAFAAALNGLDTLVFSGGIGEHSEAIRARICHGLDFLGIELEDKQNKTNENVISKPLSRVLVRVIHTNEELMLAKTVCRVLSL